MAVVRPRPKSTPRKFLVLRFIAWLIVLAGIIVLLVGSALGLYGLTVSTTVQAGDQVLTPFVTTAPPLFIATAILTGLAVIGLGQVLLALLSIEAHTRRSTLAQEKILRAHARLMRELDQRLP